MRETILKVQGSADEWRAALAEIKANQERLANCPRHRFVPGEIKLGAKVRCEVCAGEIGLVDLGYYIAGYEAAGGEADDIWPGFQTRKLGAE